MWPLHLCGLLLYTILSVGDNASTCILPKPPLHGNYSYRTALVCDVADIYTDTYIPGRVVYLSCILELTCDTGYRLAQSSGQGFLKCVNTTWIPRTNDMVCEEIPYSAQLNSGETTSAECVLPEDTKHRKFYPWTTESRGNLLPYRPGAKVQGLVRVECEDGYRLTTRSNHFTMVCFRGSWIPEKIPECEEKIQTVSKDPLPSDGQCVIPSEARHRKYSEYFLWTGVVGINSYIKFPKSTVGKFLLLKMECELGYALSDYRNFAEIMCMFNKWIPAVFPECLKMCPPLVSESMSISCSYTSKMTGLSREVDCTKGALPTVTAKYSCKSGYTEHSCMTEEGVYLRNLTCREDGRWSNILPECKKDIYSKLKTPESQRETIPGSCFLPEESNHRIFLPSTENKNSKPLWMFNPGAQVVGAIDVRCEAGYTLLGNKNQTTVICFEGKWIPEQMPECLSTTSSLMKPQLMNGGSTPSVRQRAKKFPPCFIPQELRNRIFVHTDNSGKTWDYKPGAWGGTNRAFQVYCENGYKMPGYKYNYLKVSCSGARWTRNIPECIKLCPPLYSNSMHLVCNNGNSSVNCSEPMMPNTTVEYSCMGGYKQYPCLEEEGVYSRSLTCEPSGTWSHLLPECKPACGLFNGGADAVKVKNPVTGQSMLPWHAGIYLHQGEDEDPYHYLCEGTLISSRAVLTAAHCVDSFPSNYLRVTAGKYYRSWDHEEEGAVKLKVSAVRIPPEYQSEEIDYAYFDIALLQLSGSAVSNSFILPACIDLSKTVSHQSSGYVVGWGKSSEELQVSELVIEDYEACRRTQPDVFISDKFCTTDKAGGGSQVGDGGEGVTTTVNGVHYLFGIARVKNEQSSIFTNLTWEPLRSWIEYELEYINSVNM